MCKIDSMPKGGEILSIHLGEAGVRLGDATWELYCVEHGIRPDGELCSEQDPTLVNTFFSVNSKGRCVPRAVFADTDSSSVDSLRTGKFRYLHNPKYLLSGKEDTANCFAKGYMSIGREMMEALLNRIRIAAEEASKVQGFFMYRSAGGGTGSGMGCYLLEELRNDYKKMSVIEILVYPSPKLSTIIVEPYNAMMATHSSMDTVNCTLLFSNEAVYDICDKEMDVCSPGMLNMNRLISHVLSAVTAQFRFEGEPKVSLSDFQTSLVPYPRIHFPLIGYSPLVKARSVQHTNHTVTSITSACFEPCNQMVQCNSKNGKYISCCFLYRGDVLAAEVNSAIANIKMKKSIKFVNWLPTKFKVGVSFMPPVTVPGGDIAAVSRACVMVANNTGLQVEWERLSRKFDLMFAKKAFIHWYLMEGLEEVDFLETRLDIQTLIADYREVESDV